MKIFKPNEKKQEIKQQKISSQNKQLSDEVASASSKRKKKNRNKSTLPSVTSAVPVPIELINEPAAPPPETNAVASTSTATNAVASTSTATNAVASTSTATNKQKNRNKADANVPKNKKIEINVPTTSSSVPEAEPMETAAAETDENTVHVEDFLKMIHSNPELKSNIVKMFKDSSTKFGNLQNIKQ